MKLPSNFNIEEITLHRVVQLLSLTGVNLLEPLPDDSQNTQVWDSTSEMILGRIFDINNINYRMGIGLSPFSLHLLNEQLKTQKSINITGLDKPALYSIWADWITNLGFEGKLITKLHYDLPENEHYSSNQFSEISKEFKSTWIQLRTIANQAMEKLNRLSGITSEINIWPHHFDTGVYYPITKEDGQTTQSIGAGLAMADSKINEPYFYIYGWTKKGAIDYSSAPSNDHGQWTTKGWQGAVLRASEINNLDETNTFFISSFKFLLNQLLKNK